jgi:hypothetical protein
MVGARRRSLGTRSTRAVDDGWHTSIVLRVAVVVCLLGAAIGAILLAERARPSVRPTAEREPCVYTGNSVARLAQFEAATGIDERCVLLFDNTNKDWADWENPYFATSSAGDSSWLPWVRGDSSRSLILSMSLVPESAAADWRDLGAAGAYDAHISLLAKNLVNDGLGASVIRLAAEMNGTSNVDNVGNSAADRAAWVRYWRHFVTVVREVPGANFRFDWTVNSGYRAIPLANFYPGDDVVNIIGVDQYDSLVTGTQSEPTRWATLYANPDGLAQIAAFAAQHRKLVSVPEWGVNEPDDIQPADDDAFFAAKMVEFFASVPLAYECFWFPPSSLVSTKAPLFWEAYRSYVRKALR